MSTFVRIARITVGLGTVGGVCAYYNYEKTKRSPVFAFTENSYNGITSKWDFNWDKRDIDGLVKTTKTNNGGDDDVSVKPKAIRHIILIRHGQYNLSGATDKERYLTDLGREQANFTGKRLKELDLPYTSLVHSTMTRAIETAKIIKGYLADIPVKECLLLEEGAPIPPEPPVGHWKPPHYQFHQDGARIEAAFRKYFYRADPQQEKDSFDVIVCHANVIRYFVCRALQYPPEGWLRLSLKHASITWLSILPSGRVLLRCYGDAGYMPPHALTTS